MSATVADLNPKTLENAKRQFVELYGSALVMNMQFGRLRDGRAANTSLIAGAGDDLRRWRQP